MAKCGCCNVGWLQHEKNLSLDKKISNYEFVRFEVYKIHLTDFEKCLNDRMMTKNRNEITGISKKIHSHDSMNNHPSLYHSNAMRGFGFAVIVPGIMEDAFKTGAAIVQFVHEASVLYADLILMEEERRVKALTRRSKNITNRDLGITPKVVPGKQG